MKRIHLMAISLIAYNISSFAAQHTSTSQQSPLDPAVKTMINKILVIERENAEANHQKIVNYYNQFPKTSEEELNKWVVEKEREIKENQEKYKREQKLRDVQSFMQWEKKHHRKKRYLRSSTHHLQFIRKGLKNDHRNKYQPQIKTITCYEPQLLLEWTK